MIYLSLYKHGSPKPGVAGSSPVTPAKLYSEYNNLADLPNLGKMYCVRHISHISQI